MSAKAVPCWTVVCDLCGADASVYTEFVGMTEVGNVRDYASDADWISAGNIDICDDHQTLDDPCYSCGEDDTTWAGNCAECWYGAMRS